MVDSPNARARVALAATARELADKARNIVGNVSTPMLPGERIRSARRVRLEALALVDRAVLAELADGATWDEVAEALSMTPTQAKTIHAPAWELWQNGGDADELDFGDHGVGLPGDPDLAGTAATLDQWWRRHADPWETTDDMPVTHAMDGQPST
jgi:hypothetical protein